MQIRDGLEGVSEFILSPLCVESATLEGLFSELETRLERLGQAYDRIKGYHVELTGIKTHRDCVTAAGMMEPLRRFIKYVESNVVDCKSLDDAVKAHLELARRALKLVSGAELAANEILGQLPSQAYTPPAKSYR